jgi:hypothetical protein
VCIPASIKVPINAKQKQQREARAANREHKQCEYGLQFGYCHGAGFRTLVIEGTADQFLCKQHLKMLKPA